MSRVDYRSRRAEREAFRTELAKTGMRVPQIAAAIRQRFGVNSRTACRYACGLTQQGVADQWNQLWPSDKPLTYKQVSFWEMWPAPSGRPPSIEDLTKLTRIYQCGIADLLDGGDLTTGPASEPTSKATVANQGACTQPYDITKRVDTVLAVSGPQPVAGEAGYQRLVQELIEWAHNMRRRDILQWLSSAAAAAAAAPVLDGLNPDERDRTTASFATPSRVDFQTIGHIDAVIRRCERQDDTLGPAAALETTLAQRNLVRTLLPATTGATRQRLLSLYANVLRFAGWLSFDLNDYESANTYYEQARTAAHEAHDAELGALVLCQMSHLATWRGRPRTGIDHALAASGWAMRTDDDRLKAYALDVAARAYATDHQQTAALNSINSARRLLDNSAGSPNSLVYFYNANLLISIEGSCRLSLGQAECAAAMAEQALKTIDPGFVRNIAFTSLDLGVCHMRAHKPDIPRAAQAISAAVPLAHQNRSVRLVEQLQRATTELAQWSRLPEVRAVFEQMIALGLAK